MKEDETDDKAAIFGVAECGESIEEARNSWMGIRENGAVNKNALLWVRQTLGVTSHARTHSSRS